MEEAASILSVENPASPTITIVRIYEKLPLEIKKLNSIKEIKENVKVKLHIKVGVKIDVINAFVSIQKVFCVLNVYLF